MKVTKVMTWHEMQETEHVDDNQAIQDLSVLEILSAFNLANDWIKAQPSKLTIEICTEDIKLTID